MATSTTLTIQGYRDEPVPNRFLRPEGAIDHLAVLLPGFGYTLDMPLFYYAEHLLLERGWDVLRVEYAYNKRPEFQDAARAGTGSVAAGRYDRCLARRSWPANLRARRPHREVSGHPGHGTPADTGRPASHRGSRLADATAFQERLRQQIQQYGGPSLFVIGTADPHFDPLVLEKMQVATIGEAVVVRNADHGMDIPGDPIASVRAVERVVEALGRFLA